MLHSPKISIKQSFIAAIGTFLCVAACGYIAEFSGQPLLIASFGASAFIVCAFPTVPLAQPINVFGGYLVSAVCAVAASHFLPHEIYELALAVAASSFLMFALRVPHPPAAGVPIITYFMAEKPELGYIAFPVLAGVAVIIAVAAIYNSLVKKITLYFS